MGLELKRDLKLIFEANYIIHPLPMFFTLLLQFTFDAERTFVALQFANPITKKSFNLVMELEKYRKMFGDRSMFDDEQFYPNEPRISKLKSFSKDCI